MESISLSDDGEEYVENNENSEKEVKGIELHQNSAIQSSSVMEPDQDTKSHGMKTMDPVTKLKKPECDAAANATINPSHFEESTNLETKQSHLEDSVSLNSDGGTTCVQLRLDEVSASNGLSVSNPAMLEIDNQGLTESHTKKSLSSGNIDKETPKSMTFYSTNQLHTREYQSGIESQKDSVITASSSENMTSSVEKSGNIDQSDFKDNNCAKILSGESDVDNLQLTNKILELEEQRGKLTTEMMEKEILALKLEKETSSLKAEISQLEVLNAKKLIDTENKHKQQMDQMAMKMTEVRVFL